MRKLLLAAGACFVMSSAHALSNEEFAQQVQAYQKRIKEDKKFEAEVATLCNSLGTNRRQEEPKCVAREKLATERVFGSLNTSRLK